MAIALPAVVVVLGAVLMLASAATAHLRCADGARAGARDAALGSADADVVAVARGVAGTDATVRIQHDGPWVRVDVERPVLAVHALTGAADGLVASGSAVARVEP